MVDAAHVLSPAAKADLEGKLAALETKSTIQLVVATVPGLDGQEIEPYANELFRHWKLGTAEKNNGVLLLVAPKEHRVRIEVGYGLEGTLTDAISSVIIANAATPRFKAGDFDGGVTRATDDIITTLTTDSSEWRGRPDFDSGPAPPLTLRQKIVTIVLSTIFMVVVWLIILALLYIIRRTVRRFIPGWLVTSGAGGGDSGWRYSSGGGSSGSSSFDNDFSGGGGSSGGGGASGSW